MDRMRMHVRATLPVAGLGLPLCAHAFLPPQMMDSAAMDLAGFVLVVVPMAGVVPFWLVHILPEKTAHERHHPQRGAIQAACLLSVVSGGLLWPIAWLWALHQAGRRQAGPWHGKARGLLP